MSFALGFYEIFSYAIPGFLYILVANGFLQLLGLPHFDLSKMPGTLGFALLIAVISYLAGHLFDPLAYRLYLLVNRSNADEKAVAEIKEKYTEMNIEFGTGDRRMLYSFIKHRSLALAEYLDKFNAIGILLQNLSLGLFLFALTQIAYIFITGQILGYGLGALLGLAFSFIAVKRSALFKSWYSQGIFEQALHYGTSVEKMFKDERQAEKDPSSAPARKTRSKVKADRAETSEPAASKTRDAKKKVT